MKVHILPKPLHEIRMFRKAKWSEEALQITEEKREAKGKGEKERYPSECRVPKDSKDRLESLSK